MAVVTLTSTLREKGEALEEKEVVLQNIDANTKMIDLGVRQRAIEEELAWTAGECDVQRAAVEQKAREAEAQTTELQRLRTTLEEKAREAEAQSAEL